MFCISTEICRIIPFSSVTHSSGYPIFSLICSKPSLMQYRSTYRVHSILRTHVYQTPRRFLWQRFIRGSDELKAESTAECVKRSHGLTARKMRTESKRELAAATAGEVLIYLGFSRRIRKLMTHEHDSKTPLKNRFRRFHRAHSVAVSD